MTPRVSRGSNWHASIVRQAHAAECPAAAMRPAHFRLVRRQARTSTRWRAPTRAICWRWPMSSARCKSLRIPWGRTYASREDHASAAGCGAWQPMGSRRVASERLGGQWLRIVSVSLTGRGEPGFRPLCACDQRDVPRRRLAHRHHRRARLLHVPVDRALNHSGSEKTSLPFAFASPPRSLRPFQMAVSKNKNALGQACRAKLSGCFGRPIGAANTANTANRRLTRSLPSNSRFCQCARSSPSRRLGPVSSPEVTVSMAGGPRLGQGTLRVDAARSPAARPGAHATWHSGEPEGHSGCGETAGRRRRSLERSAGLGLSASRCLWQIHLRARAPIRLDPNPAALARAASGPRSPSWTVP